MLARVPILVALSMALTACASDFDPYNLLAEPRLLAIRAEPPTVALNGTTTLDTLIYNPGDAPVTYQWSWCPLRAGTTQNWDSAISENAINEQLQAMGVAGGSVRYDLGTEPTATLSYPLDPTVFAALCQDPGSSLPDNVAMPSCEQGFPLSVGLTIRIGDLTIRAFKDVALALNDSTPLNHNPMVDALRFGAKGASVDQATMVAEDQPPLLSANQTYALYADVPAESAEPILRTFSASNQPPYGGSENLVVTWFITAGTTRFMRTTYIEGEDGFDALASNEWTTPRDNDITSDNALLVLVLRDERGGVAWLHRAFNLAH